MATPEWKPGLSRSMARPVGLPSVARGERSGGPPSLALNSPRALVDILRRRVPGAKDGKDGLPSVARGERGDSPPSLALNSPASYGGHPSLASSLSEGWEGWLAIRSSRRAEWRSTVARVEFTASFGGHPSPASSRSEGWEGWLAIRSSRRAV